MLSNGLWREPQKLSFDRYVVHLGCVTGRSLKLILCKFHDSTSAPILPEVFKGFFYMCKFGGASVERHMVLSNCRGFLGSLVAKGGYLTVEDRNKMAKIKLAVQHANRSGHVKNKFSGVKKLLKASQSPSLTRNV